VKDPTSWLNPEFWGNVLRDTVAWAIVAAPRVLLVLVMGFVLFKLLNVLVGKIAGHALGDQADTTRDAKERQKRAETLLGIVQKTGRVVIWALLVMLLMMQVGLDVAPLIAGAGIMGLAVGFGAQELVRDVITGFFMLLENQIRIGDVAVVNGTGGVVEQLSLRTVVLRDLSGVVHVFQNGKVETLANMTKEWSAMVFDVGVAYKEDTDQVVDVMREVADELQQDPEFASKILEPMEIFGLDSFGDSAVIIKARLKTRPIEQWTVGREYRRRLKQAFDARHIEIPFPNRTLHFAEGEPPSQRRLPSRERDRRPPEDGTRLHHG
jgi:small conductance mechanosensitive channel